MTIDSFALSDLLSEIFYLLSLLLPMPSPAIVCAAAGRDRKISHDWRLAGYRAGQSRCERKPANRGLVTFRVSLSLSAARYLSRKAAVSDPSLVLLALAPATFFLTSPLL